MSAPATTTDPAATLTQAITHMLPDLGLGGVLGYATGLAVKAVGRVALIVVGLLFIAVQVLASMGIVTVDWLKLQTLTEPWFRHSSEAGVNWFSHVLTNQLPFAGAFVAGFLLGLRR